jgi:hypothetical protein
MLILFFAFSDCFLSSSLNLFLIINQNQVLNLSVMSSRTFPLSHLDWGDTLYPHALLTSSVCWPLRHSSYHPTSCAPGGRRRRSREENSSPTLGSHMHSLFNQPRKPVIKSSLLFFTEEESHGDIKPWQGKGSSHLWLILQFKVFLECPVFPDV